MRELEIDTGSVSGLFTDIKPPKNNCQMTALLTNTHIIENTFSKAVCKNRQCGTDGWNNRKEKEIDFLCTAVCPCLLIIA